LVKIKWEERLKNVHMVASKNMTAGKAKKSGKPRKAPKVKNSRPDANFMREADTKLRLKSPMLPMKQKRLSK
jgi:hypothetical protein